MAQALSAKEDAMVWQQTAQAADGSVIGEREVLLAPEEARQQAYKYIDFLKSTGADLRRSVLSTIEANKLKIDSLLGDIRSSRSSDQVQPLGQALNAAVELSKHLEAIYRMLGILTEGTIRIRRLDDRTHPQEPTYGVTFSPYDRGGGSIPMPQFVGRERLLTFLEEGLRIDKSAVIAAFRDLDADRPASIPRVVLTYYDAVRSGLAAWS